MNVAANGGWLRLILPFVLGIGTAIAGTFLTFETKSAHDTDVLRIELQRQRDREELMQALGRIEDKVDGISKGKTR